MRLVCLYLFLFFHSKQIGKFISFVDGCHLSFSMKNENLEFSKIHDVTYDIYIYKYPILKFDSHEEKKYKKFQPFFYILTVWSDLRTEETVEKVLDKIPNRDPNHFKAITGLPISPYFSALKIKWLVDNVPEIAKAFKNGSCLVGNIDSWLVWVSFFLLDIFDSKL